MLFTKRGGRFAKREWISGTIRLSVESSKLITLENQFRFIDLVANGCHELIEANTEEAATPY